LSSGFQNFFWEKASSILRRPSNPENDVGGNTRSHASEFFRLWPEGSFSGLCTSVQSIVQRQVNDDMNINKTGSQRSEIKDDNTQTVLN